MKIEDRTVDRVISGVFIVLALAIALVLGSFSLRDLKESKKAEETIDNLVELRVALEKYYQLTKHYPDLTQEGVKDNLRLLDYVDEYGNKISFADIYGREAIPKTPNTEVIGESNDIFNTKNFDNGTETGGWNYDYANQTGEIHANLSENAYFQGIKWKEY